MINDNYVFIDDISEDIMEKGPGKKPSWLKIRHKSNSDIVHTSNILKKGAMHTICVEGACPNRHECWSSSHASFLLMGDVCTRACRFCNVKTGRPNELDDTEPERLANTIVDMNIKYAVLTSVDRDDINDGGASHFVKCINAIRKLSPSTTIELLTPDFRKSRSVEPSHLVVANAMPDVFGHNIETVARLHKKIRPAARYFHSIMILLDVKRFNPRIVTKSGIMLGLGETYEEVVQAMDDLRAAKVDCLTIGQYLRPSDSNVEVSRYVAPEEFEKYKEIATKKGFAGVSSGPFVRTSYKASTLYKAAIEFRQVAV